MLGVGQLLFKSASRVLVGIAPSGAVGALVRSPVFYLAPILYGCATLLWIWIIRDVPLSRAYCFAALCFVIVPALAAIFLGEPWSWKVLAGAVIIAVGIVVTQL